LSPAPLFPVVLDVPLRTEASGDMADVPEPVLRVWLPVSSAETFPVAPVSPEPLLPVVFDAPFRIEALATWRKYRNLCCRSGCRAD
jgi:hypothetical protein